jgi:hypothetical protein
MSHLELEDRDGGEPEAPRTILSSFMQGSHVETMLWGVTETTPQPLAGLLRRCPATRCAIVGKKQFALTHSLYLDVSDSSAFTDFSQNDMILD